MKLKSCFLLMCMVAAMLACSDNDDPVEQPKTPVISDAALALSAQTADRVIVKAATGDLENTIGDGMIKNLAMVVFDAGAYQDNGYKTGDVVLVATSSAKPGETMEISGVGLVSGDVEILLIANAEQKLIDNIRSMATENTGLGHNNKSDVLALTTSLGNEVEFEQGSTEKGLTMTKLLTGITLLPGDNYIGYADEKGGSIGNSSLTDLYGKVELVRTVARVELNSLTLKVSDEYKSLRFKLKEVFLANVKSLSGIGDGNTTEIAYDGKNDFYWVGSDEWTTLTGYYKTGIAKQSDLLFAGINHSGELDVNKTLNSGVLKDLGNKYFYVYPNTKGETEASETKAEIEPNYTLLVVKGDYTYEVNGSPFTEKDRYYTVVINDKRTGAETNDHISRNIKYWVNLTIAGNGSDSAYDPATSAHVSAQVEVTKWNVVNIDEKVD